VSFSNVILTADQLALVQRVFKQIVMQPWFIRNTDNESAFASHIVRQFQKGISDEGALVAQCEAAARERYSVNVT